jgi:hypothetical protein
MAEKSRLLNIRIRTKLKEPLHISVNFVITLLIAITRKLYKIYQKLLL